MYLFYTEKEVELEKKYFLICICQVQMSIFHRDLNSCYITLDDCENQLNCSFYIAYKGKGEVQAHIYQNNKSKHK